MRRAMLAAALLVLSAGGAVADEVWLKGGGRIVGEVIDRTPSTVLVDVGPGTVKLPMARVERIVGTSSRLSEFRSRAARLNPQDVQGWLALAAWANQNDMRTQARGAWEQVLAVDPTNTVAQQGLGNVFQGGHWMDRSAALRAQGLVEVDGNWMSPADADMRFRAQVAADVAERESALADARVAEAEARAREAEARARAAEAEVTRAQDTSLGGIPLGYGYGAVGIGTPVFGDPIQSCCGQHHSPGFCPSRRRHDPPPAPRPTPPPRDGNSSPRTSHAKPRIG
jgi:hypothetical protein